jgi:signal transduction histidine kinase
MIQLHLLLDGDDAAAERLRSLLAREGFRISDAADPQAGEVVTAENGALGGDALSRRIEELELSLRELRNLDVAKSQFLANVSHELRTPLTAIVTYGEVLRDGLLGAVNPRQVEALQSVIGSSRQLLTMIEEILTYARTNARAIELESTEFHIGEVIADVQQMSASLLRKKRLYFEARIEEGVPTAHADRDKVLHVLGNLIGNAIEFTPPEGSIRVEVKRCARAPECLEVIVADTGIGIDPTHHEMIFQEFAQVDSSRARRHHGTGLGLAIAKSFITLHGGEIWVESELGAGSNFCFTIPCVAPAENGNGE